MVALLADADGAGTVIGVVALAVSGFFAFLNQASARKHDLARAQADWRIALLEEREKECEKRTAGLTTEIALLKERHAATPASGFYIWAKLDERILDVTDGVKDILGWRPAELIGLGLDVLIPEAIRPQHHAGINRVKDRGTILRPPDVAIKTKAKTRSGHVVDVVVSLDMDHKKGDGVIRAEVMARGAIPDWVSPV